MQARSIPDEDVELPHSPDGPAFVVSSQRAFTYEVEAPTTKWAGCNCNWARGGDICKHQLKVIMLMMGHSEIDLAQLLGSRFGRTDGGMAALHARTPATRQPAVASPQRRRSYAEAAKRQVHRTDAASLSSQFQSILELSEGNEEVATIAGHGLAATLGRMKNASARAAGRSAMEAADRAEPLQHNEGDNSLIRGKPLIEQLMTRRKKKQPHVPASEVAAQSLPKQPSKPKKLTMRQELASKAGALPLLKENVPEAAPQHAPAPQPGPSDDAAQMPETAAMASAAPSQPQSAPQQPGIAKHTPAEVAVTCGSLDGKFVTEPVKGSYVFRVVQDGEVITMGATQFEAEGGRGASKNWKKSSRVVIPGGSETLEQHMKQYNSFEFATSRKGKPKA